MKDDVDLAVRQVASNAQGLLDAFFGQRPILVLLARHNFCLEGVAEEAEYSFHFSSIFGV